MALRRLTGLASAAAVVAATTLAVAAPAHGQISSVNCTGSQTAHYAPPLGPLPRQTTVQVTERLGEDGDGTCTGPFTGGIGTAVFHQSGSCLTPPPAGTLPEPNVITYNWHTGEHSTITFIVTGVVRVGGQTSVTSAGTVIDGFGEGAPATRVKTLLDLDVEECVAASVEQREGSMTLTIG